jgi:predicted nucleic acid-binding protein
VKRIVLDASALMTFFENRPGAEKVEEVIQLAIDSKRELFMSIVNWGEVYYSVWRTKGPGVALKLVADIAQLPIELVNADYELTRHAAEFRAQHKLPYADCFAAALALNRKASLITSDADFTQVEKQVTILWTSPP